MIEYEFALFLDGKKVAVSSSSSLEEIIAEAHYAQNAYIADGEIEIKYYERKEIFV